MTQEVCPFCKNAINQGAEVCHSCGAQKGYNQAGQSKHVSGVIGLFCGALSYSMLASDDALSAMVGLFFGVVTLGLFVNWMSNLMSSPTWYRPHYNNRR